MNESSEEEYGYPGMLEAAKERSYWRDIKMGLRHRLWGFDCPAVDIDHLLIEYSYGRPCAIIEHKHKKAKPPDLKHPNYKALVNLADGYRRGAIPFFIAIYDPDVWSFKTICMNNAAVKIYNQPIGVVGAEMTEQQYVLSLYKMRGDVKITRRDEIAISKLNNSLKKGGL